MNTVSLSIKTEPELKAQTQQIANKIGVSVTDLVNGYLKQLVKHQSSLINQTEYPTTYLLEAVERARKERKVGKVSPIFDNPEEAINWLNS